LDGVDAGDPRKFMTLLPRNRPGAKSLVLPSREPPAGNAAPQHQHAEHIPTSDRHLTHQEARDTLRHHQRAARLDQLAARARRLAERLEHNIQRQETDRTHDTAS
jgi:hypothetical protein